MQREEEVVYLYLDDIIPNRFQPREIFEERPLKELAVSIKEHGVIQPIIVRKVNDKYEIIAGERRYKASALAGLTKIPAIIRDLDDKESSKIALLENLQRKNLNPIEEAKTYQKILELDQMTQEELAKTMGKSQSAVANKLRLLSLPDEVQQALLKEQISERHARSLLNLDDSEKQREMLKKIVDNKMTVRQVEDEIKGKNSTQDTFSSSNTDEKLSILNNKDIPTAENFIPENPLMPNLNGENTDINTPILSSISNFTSNDNSSSESESKTPQFINFGDIKSDDEDSFNEGEELLFSAPPNNLSSSINIDELRKNALDINTPNSNTNGHDLDSLLNLSNPVPTNNEATNEFKFFSPAREAIKNSEVERVENNSEDYFKAPDLISVDLPEEVQTDGVNGVGLENSFNINSATPKIVEENKINKAIDLIRNNLKVIENMGLKVNVDEMDLDDSYQIVIKMEK